MTQQSSRIPSWVLGWDEALHILFHVKTRTLHLMRFKFLLLAISLMSPLNVFLCGGWGGVTTSAKLKLDGDMDGVVVK